MSVTLTINNRRVVAADGATILEAARAAGIRIPTLCHHPDLSDVGACRMCVVSVERSRGLQTACTTPVFDGMVVDSESPDARATRRFVLEMLLTDHPNECMTCEVNGNCELQDLVYEYEVAWPDHDGKRHAYPIDPDPNPFILIDRNKCIVCSRCVRACDSINGVEAISIVHRGFSARIAFGMDSTMQDSPCEFCGSCVEVCPTAALWPKMSIGKGRPWQFKQTPTTCSYCGVGCQLVLHTRDNAIVKVTGGDGPANHGYTCVKGRFGYDFVNHEDRLSRPLVRRYLLEGKTKPKAGGNGHHTDTGMELVETTWDSALDITARKFAEVKKQHGGDAFAALCSARCTNEENFLMAKLTRQVMQTHNIDHCARL